ncbi:hypothetical protein ACFQ1L_38420 [Phytohabitans flavus]|nr:hypothetical protein [Phytohabitans flavus]
MQQDRRHHQPHLLRRLLVHGRHHVARGGRRHRHHVLDLSLDNG